MRGPLLSASGTAGARLEHRCLDSSERSLCGVATARCQSGQRASPTDRPPRAAGSPARECSRRRSRCRQRRPNDPLGCRSCPPGPPPPALPAAGRAPSSVAVIAGRFFSPISTTTVPRSRPAPASRPANPGASGGEVPGDHRELVRDAPVGDRDAGQPPGTAIALVTPGTTVTGTPAAAQASTSSPPRPKTYGSPPLSRTTKLRPAPGRPGSG